MELAYPAITGSPNWCGSWVLSLAFGINPVICLAKSEFGSWWPNAIIVGDIKGSVLCLLVRLLRDVGIGISGHSALSARRSLSPPPKWL